MNRTFFLLSIIALFQNIVCQQDCIEADTDYTGFDVEEGIYTSEISALACQEKCQDNIYCAYWTWDTTYKNACWKKTDKGPVNPASGLTSGPKFCDAEFDLGKIRVMSYNMFGWNALHNEYKTKNLFKTIRAGYPDLIGCQEDEGMNEMIAINAGANFAVAGGRSAGHSILYRTDVFEAVKFDHVGLTPQDIYGLRTVEYVQLNHLPTGKPVDVFNTHWCICIQGKCCGQENQFQSAKEVQAVIEQVKRPDSTVIFMGDLNVEDGGENAMAIQYLKGNWAGESPPIPLEDSFRIANPDGNGETFNGKGKLDYIFVLPGTTVTEAKIDRSNYGDASDHWPISAVITM